MRKRLMRKAKAQRVPLVIEKMKSDRWQVGGGR
jgi:hypothetical protein